MKKDRIELGHGGGVDGTRHRRRRSQDFDRPFEVNLPFAVGAVLARLSAGFGLTAEPETDAGTADPLRQVSVELFERP